jgi:hypothetical protein
MKKAAAIYFLTCAFLISAHAQTTTLRLENGKASVKKNFSPRKKSDAHFYRLALVKGRTAEIKVVSNSVLLFGENECGVYFEIFDGKGEKLFLGDDPAGISEWKGGIEETGNYKIKIFMSCPEAFSTADLQRKKPKFEYLLEILMN